MVLLFCFGKAACGSPVYSMYGDTEDAKIEVPGCPIYPNKPDEVNFGYTEAQILAGSDCRKYVGANAKLTVLTYAFNTFCFMNLFNMINCRKIGAQDKNVFERATHNWTFIGVFFGTFAAHITLVQCCSVLLRTVASESRGEWGGAIAVGASVLAIALLLKLTPSEWVERISVDRFVNEDEAVQEGSLAARMTAGYKNNMTGDVPIERA